MLGMDASEIIAAAIAAGGGNLAVGKELGISDEGVRLWKERGVVPAKYVIALAELGKWQYTPHKIAPDLYPHDDDGLPAGRRNGGGQLAEVSA
jgi:hypothetical protein